ncbi:hypothetical protein P4O66_000568 [Electrophorus voltai]|uniref:Uncharacterized protein n=1 Tax=Electrophorus voltai TaxID=2609070 RepID=A0AAD8ZHB5_9TELE|nr:hypothetical protein P4O66_000568 [Electrophorus voltai]
MQAQPCENAHAGTAGSPGASGPHLTGPAYKDFTTATMHQFITISNANLIAQPTAPLIGPVAHGLSVNHPWPQLLNGEGGVGGGHGAGVRGMALTGPFWGAEVGLRVHGGLCEGVRSSSDGVSQGQLRRYQDFQLNEMWVIKVSKSLFDWAE